MKSSDYIAILALVVSLISAGISIRSWRFNVKVKSLELRALLLASLHNALVKAEGALADYRVCKNEALDAKRIEIFKSLTLEQNLDDILKKLGSEIQQAEAVSGYKAVDHYQRSISRITAVSLRVDGVSNSVTALKTALTAVLLKERERQNPSNLSPTVEGAGIFADI